MAFASPLRSTRLALKITPRHRTATASRCLHTSSIRYNDQARPPSSRDPSHPNLYYHPLPSPPPGRIALSFLSQPPIPYSRTVLGYLPMTRDSDLSDFREEPRFWDVLHGAIKSGLNSGKAETVDFEAEARPGDGYIHLTDERAVPPAGRIGETEDLIASIFVKDGKVVTSTYEPLPSYRLVTLNGPLVLPKGLDTHVVSVLEGIAAEERAEESKES